MQKIEFLTIVLYFSRHAGREISLFIETDAALAYAKEIIQGWLDDGYKVDYEDIPSRLLYAKLGGEGDDIYVETAKPKDGPAIFARAGAPKKTPTDFVYEKAMEDRSHVGRFTPGPWEEIDSKTGEDILGRIGLGIDQMTRSDPNVTAYLNVAIFVDGSFVRRFAR